MTHKTYDFFILGCGPAGQSLAISAREAGHSVGITESREYGGTCPIRGCDPKKVFYGAAKAMNGVIRLQGKGFKDKPAVSWPDLQAWKSTFTDPIPPATVKKLTEKGIECLEGAAMFTGPGKINVGDDVTVSATQVVIATGAKPAPLDIPGKEHYLDSAGFLEMEELPKRLLIIGSGYIGSSFAQISATMGAEVTVVASGDSPVDNFDQDLNDLVTKAAEDHGIKFYFNTKAAGIEKAADGSYEVVCEPEDGEQFRVATDQVIHCAGRVPNVKGMGLDKAGIDFDDKGIAVNKKLCTSVSAHYAIGDCANSGLPLTPVATYEARLLADNLFQGKNREVDYLPIPTVAFTLPPITAVGLTVDQANEDERDLTIKFEDTTEWFSNAHVNAVVSAYKLIIDEKEDLIVGAHLLGDHADEVINLFSLAIHQKIKITTLQHLVLAYPSAGADIKKMIG
ncbi:dihydrolipoyl dehydrogenase family protein [Neolewinella antarctica]|uniref:Glutathione reductase (NADPH) n=1 Tax=Neolewinella antarctica TaxID=442734 RepID=A0ABX0X8I3_9BACT|nr:NAD(P)/FAD-dependent oxidoreductase [Neolewinella antarctica]NJC25303.1 glutathione reductase (NADPH) [Neolewinella antarctica]